MKYFCIIFSIDFFLILFFNLQVLAAGLSGLYSMLPRTLTIENEGWHRFTSEDISEIPQLQVFLNSLAFCNAVVQVSSNT